MVAPVKGGRRGSILIEMTTALAVLLGVVLPVAFSAVYEARMARVSYYRAVAMEIVDGEMEVLAAGEWRAFGEGTRDYAVRAAAAQSLPPGRFVLTVNGRRVRLEWIPQRPGAILVVKREVVLP